jgi:transposase
MYICSSTIKTKTGLYTRHLLRHSYRCKITKKVKHRSIANLSHCSKEELDAIRLALKHKNNLQNIGQITHSQKQGKSIGAIHLLHTIAKRIGIQQALGNTHQSNLALWQIYSRIIEQGSRLSAVRLANRHNYEILNLDQFNEHDLYNNLDWLSDNQSKIEDRLFSQKTKPQLFLYDVTSSYLEGQQNEFAEYGYNRDKKKSKLQIVIGLLEDQDGNPISVQVFQGNTNDLSTLESQIQKTTQRFKANSITFVGDKGMIKSKQIESIKKNNLHYITSISKKQMESLLKQSGQLSLDEEDLQEIIQDNTRYIFRRNPSRAEEIKQNRQQKLERLKKLISDRNQYIKNHKRSKPQTSLKLAITKSKQLKIDKWINIALTDSSELTIEINQEVLLQESKFDGCYTIKTDLPQTIDKNTIHNRYKDLALVEHTFRTFKMSHLELRPIYVRLKERTRGHVFIVMLAYRIIKELNKYWQSLNITTQEAISELSAIHQSELTINDQVFNEIPEPNALCKKLLKLAQVELPKILPKTKNVDTRKKLQDRRKIR